MEQEYYDASSEGSESMKGKKKRVDKQDRELEAARRIFKAEAGAQLRGRLYQTAFASLTKLIFRMLMLSGLGLFDELPWSHEVGVRHLPEMAVLWSDSLGKSIAPGAALCHVGSLLFLQDMAGLDMMARVARDTELMRSFLRTGGEQERNEDEPKRKSQFASKKTWLLSKELKEKKRPKKSRHEEVYTDKDRAAAVNMGTRDIKQSLRLKKKEERSKALEIPEETRSETLLALAGYEVRARRQDLAFKFISKAIDLNPEDKAALVERSKCFLLMGEPKLALKDAEAALTIQPTYIKALLQKAESLYHLGKFEEALVYFHRGAKVRPDMSGFRLGIAKATEAIQNIIGEDSVAFSGSGESLARLLKGLKTVEDVVRTTEEGKSGSQRTLLGSLQQDKDYLHRILKEKADVINLPESFAQNETELQAREILAYLGSRSEFWRQQKPKAR